MIPSGARPTCDDIFGSVELDYRLVPDVIALIAFAVLLSLTARRARPDGP